VKTRITAIATVLVLVALAALAFATGTDAAGSGQVTTALVVDRTDHDTPIETTMYLGSDLFGVGAPCTVALPLDPGQDRDVRILNIDGRPTDQVFVVSGQWLYSDRLHSCDYPYCTCANGWFDGCAPAGTSTTSMTGAIVIPAGSVTPANPTDTPLTVHVLLKGTLKY
jgi:hypothetical protein